MFFFYYNNVLWDEYSWFRINIIRQNNNLQISTINITKTEKSRDQLFIPNLT